MSEYDADRKWSDQYIPLIKRIVGPYLLEESSAHIDQKEATDLIVITTGRQQIGCRVRRPQYWPRYAGEFTIRGKRKSGAKTEMRKIIEGFCDLMFYGFASDSAQIGFSEWYLINLRHWRSHLIFNRKVIKCGVTPNPDGKTSFEWFVISSFPPEPPLLEASSVSGPDELLPDNSTKARLDDFYDSGKAAKLNAYIDSKKQNQQAQQQLQLTDFGRQNAGY